MAKILFETTTSGRVLIILSGLMGVAIAGYVVPSCGLFEYHHRDEDMSATTSSHSYPDGLDGAHHASIGMFRYHVLLEEDDDDGASSSSSCDFYNSSSFFYNPNPSIFISQICSLAAPILGLFGVVLQLFAKTYRSFANLLWLFAFGAQIMTWSLIFDASFCFQKGDKDFATCTVTFAGYSNMLAAGFFLVAYVWSLTCYHKPTRPPSGPTTTIVIESPKIEVVEVPIGTSDSDVSDDDISLPDILMTELEDETIDDDDEDPKKELDGEVVDKQGQVVKELVEHKRFQEQGMKSAASASASADV